LQKETTLGTPVTTAMKRYHGIKGTIGWDVQEETFTAAGSSAPTGKNTLTELGTANLEVMQDYNAMLPLLAGVFGPPVTTPLETTPTPAYEHVFTINPFAATPIVPFTAMWGDTTQALQAAAMVFHALTIGVQRTQLSLSASAILNAPKTGIALPTTGVTDVPFVPVRAQSYCVYMDDDVADLGTTQLLALYGTEIAFGERLTPDWVVNCNLDSYADLLEQEEINRTQSLVVGFDAASVGMIDDWHDGKLKYVRVESTGPDINGTDAYGLTIDTAVSLKPTDVGKSPVSPATVVNFDGTLMVGASNFLAKATLVNGISGL
jgi:hypothetical protein